jgi:A/G-specific adenine glycosylase
MRLHQAATAISRDHAGEVPLGLDALLALPGIGDYTARAIRTFAFAIPEPVVDTNVRRVIARASHGQGEAGPPRMTADRDAVWGVLSPMNEELQVQGAKALMELGAIVCTARKPLCEQCPIRDACAWRTAGYPVYQGVTAPRQARFEGSDRQVRGIIVRELRHSDTPVPETFLVTLWHDPDQYERALASLIEDGLAAREADGITLAS